MDKTSKGHRLIARGIRLIAEAFEERPLPDRWAVGQRVRYIRDSDFAWSKGSFGFIVEVDPNDSKKRPSDYQVFKTSPEGMKRQVSWWTTPSDVELAVEESDKAKAAAAAEQGDIK